MYTVRMLSVMLAIGPLAPAARAHASEPPSPVFARPGAVVSPPVGYVQLCARLPSLCETRSGDVRRVVSLPTRLAELDEINRAVNREVAPVEDIVQFGVQEYWTLPATGKGDCEEYVLEKRERLMQRGWPSGALLITVVLDENRQGHAVLTTRMTAGDLILDNKHDEIKLWSQTPYIYVMRQSIQDPDIWLSLEMRDGSDAAATASRRTP